MKYSWLFIVGCTIGLCLPANGQEACVQARKVLEKVNSLHIQPRMVNDSLSADIFSEFFHLLDPQSQFFISKDTGWLVRYRSKLDDGNEPVCSFINESIKLFRKKAEWYKNFTDSVLARPIDLTKEEFGPPIIAPGEGAVCNTNSELKRGVMIQLKLDVLISMYRHLSLIPGQQLTPKLLGELEQAARNKVKRNALVKIDQLLKDGNALAVLVSKTYLKAIPGVFDPHSTFFTKEEMSEFNGSVSASALSFGLNLEESPMGEVKVSSVVPGGPAWNSNQLNQGDVLVGIKQKSGQYIDLSDLDQSVVQNFLQKQNDVTELTVKKATGEIRNVKLLKKELENEENIVSGFVLKGKTSKRSIGYINLPGFFSDANNPGSKGCAVAVAREILKLKGESIQGLILDLRFNGGGSMLEAMDLAGLFIDGGPLGVIEMRGNAPVTMKDMNRGLVYDGPLVIMVNGASASASELVAGALQDHRRAIIMGSPTYGKGSAQDLIPLNDKDSTQGFLKVTVMRLYRIDGQSHQLTGVIPDFNVRDLSTVIYPREEEARHAMKQQSIKKKTYYTPLTSTWEEGLMRTIEFDPIPGRFTPVIAMEETLSAKVPLEYKSFFSFMKNWEEKSAAANEEMSMDQDAYTVFNSKFDASVLSVDTYHKEITDEIMSQVESSIYIHEAYRLLDNIITTSKK